MDARKNNAVACLCGASIVGTLCVVEIVSLVHRSRSAEEMARKFNQPAFGDAMERVTQNFDQKLGGSANAVGFLLVAWLTTILLFLDVKGRFFAAANVCAAVYSTVLMVYIIGASERNIKECEGIYLVEGTGPYGDCSIQREIEDEFVSIRYPIIWGTAIITALVYLMFAVQIVLSPEPPNSYSALFSAQKLIF